VVGSWGHSAQHQAFADRFESNSEPDSRMFYKADGVSSGRSSFLSRDATELVPMMMMMMILIYVQETSRRVYGRAKLRI
jgi:hypothetical protein